MAEPIVVSVEVGAAMIDMAPSVLRDHINRGEVPTVRFPSTKRHGERSRRVLVLVDDLKALVLLQEVRNIQDVKQIADVAKAAGVYAREHKLGAAVVMKARAVTFEALRRLGELLADTERATGGQPYQTSTGTCPEPVEKLPTLAELGLEKKKSSYAQQLARLPRADFDRIRDGRTTLEKLRAEAKQKKEEERAEAWEQFLRSTLCDLDGVDGECRVVPTADLFELGIRADVVMSEPPVVRGQLQLFSDLALACVHAPLVLIAMPPSCVLLPEILPRLSEHLTYRGLFVSNERLVLGFHPDGQRARKPRSFGWQGNSSWASFCVRHFTEEGDLIVDPFMSTGTTAVAALKNSRRFVGGSDDPAMIADPRSRIKEIVTRYGHRMAPR